MDDERCRGSSNFPQGRMMAIESLGEHSHEQRLPREDHYVNVNADDVT